MKRYEPQSPGVRGPRSTPCHCHGFNVMAMRNSKSAAAARCNDFAKCPLRRVLPLRRRYADTSQRFRPSAQAQV